MTNPEEGVGQVDKNIQERLEDLENFVALLATGGHIDRIPIHVLPGGRIPRRATDGAVGFDAYSRAIVDPFSKPTIEKPLRRNRADFDMTPDFEDKIDKDIASWVDYDKEQIGKYVIKLPPDERCMIGLGVVTAMPFPLFYDVRPRSGYAARGINLDNAPGTVDPDYRGEAGALITNRSKEPFIISHEMRIVQFVYHLAIIPGFEEVADINDLPGSIRGVGGFGSTGTRN